MPINVNLSNTACDYLPLTGGTLTGGLTGIWVSLTLTPSVTAASQTLNAAPTATTLTAANTKTFVASGGNIVLPAITPAANGGGITLTGLALSQGAIGNVADSEAITVKQLVITGAAGAALATGVYTWTGADITMPAQAANGATNLAKGIKITGGAKAGGASATQIGLDITMAASTDSAITVNTGACSFKGITLGGTVTGGSQVINSIGHIGIGADSSSVRNIYISEAYASTGSAYITVVYPSATMAQTSAAFSGQFTGERSEVGIAAANNQNWTHAVAGCVAQFGYVYTITGSTGTITGMASFLTDCSIVDAAAVTNYYGLYVTNPTVAGAKLVNAYGIYVAAITGGATLNYAFYAAGGLMCSIGSLGVGTAPYATQPAGSIGAAAGVMIGGNSLNNLIDDASGGAGSTAMYIGNAKILVNNGINFGPSIVTSITVVGGQITAIS